MPKPPRPEPRAPRRQTNLASGKFRDQKAGAAYHHGDLAVALLDAAEDALREGDVAGLAVRALARRVGVTHMAAYHHYPSRADLLAAVAARGYDHLGDAMARRARGHAPREALREVGVAYVKFAVAHAAHFRLMFSSELEALRAHEPLNTAAARSFAVFADTLRAAAPPHAAVDTAAVAAWALVHGASVLLLDRQVPGHTASARDAERLARSVLGEVRLTSLG